MKNVILFLFFIPLASGADLTETVDQCVASMPLGSKWTCICRHYRKVMGRLDPCNESLVKTNYGVLWDQNFREESQTAAFEFKDLKRLRATPDSPDGEGRTGRLAGEFASGQLPLTYFFTRQNGRLNANGDISLLANRDSETRAPLLGVSSTMPASLTERGSVEAAALGRQGEAPSRSAVTGTNILGASQPLTISDSGGFQSGASLALEAASRSQAARDEASRRAEFLQQLSNLDTRIAKSVGNNMAEVKNEVGPLLRSPNAEVRAQAMARLREPPKEPAELKGIYSELGLNTKEDVLRKGKETVERINQDAKTQINHSKKWREEVQKANHLVEELELQKEVLETRKTNLASVDPAQAYPLASGRGIEDFSKTSKREGLLESGGSREEQGKRSDKGSADSTISRKTGRFVASVPSEKTESEWTEAKVKKDSARVNLENTESLREILRRRLLHSKSEARSGSGGSMENAPSKMAHEAADRADKPENFQVLGALPLSAEQDRGRSMEKNVSGGEEAATSVAGEKDRKLAEERHATEDSSADPERALGEKSSGVEKDEPSIFERVRGSLTRCQREKRI